MNEEAPRPGDTGPQEEQERRPVSEKTESESRLPPGGGVIYKAIYQQGENELRRTSLSLFWSALAAGLSMGFSFAAESAIAASLPEAPWRPLVAKFGYGVGFLIVVLGSQQLFTENTLTVVLPLLARRTGGILRNVFRLWSLVLAANLLGAFAFAWAVGHAGLFPERYDETFHSFGREAFRVGFGTAMARGIVAGWIIALMVWLLPYAESSRIWVVLILSWLIGVLQAPHVVAGSVNAFYLVATGDRSLGEALVRYTIPVLIGNMIGGISLVASFGHAQFGRPARGTKRT